MKTRAPKNFDQLLDAANKRLDEEKARHEKLSKVQDCPGIPCFDVTYEILRDGEALSFNEHMDLVRLLNWADRGTAK